MVAALAERAIVTVQVQQIQRSSETLSGAHPTDVMDIDLKSTPPSNGCPPVGEDGLWNQLDAIIKGEDLGALGQPAERFFEGALASRPLLGSCSVGFWPAMVGEGAGTSGLPPFCLVPGLVAPKLPWDSKTGLARGAERFDPRLCAIPALDGATTVALAPRASVSGALGLNFVAADAPLPLVAAATDLDAPKQKILIDLVAEYQQGLITPERLMEGLVQVAGLDAVAQVFNLPLAPQVSEPFYPTFICLPKTKKKGTCSAQNRIAN